MGFRGTILFILIIIILKNCMSILKSVVSNETCTGPLMQVIQAKIKGNSVM
jgi:hypothetical protein